MKTIVINVGKEVLTGKTVNTNLTTIARKLQTIGIDVTRSFIIDDVKQEYFSILDIVDEDLVIFTGGLGPTIDDITRETVLEYYKCETYLNKEVLQTIQGYFDRIGKIKRDTNDKQALFPIDSTVLKNDRGTAPGLFFKTNNKIIVLLPGPPYENEPMMDEVIQLLKQEIKIVLYTDGFKLVGTGESWMEHELKGFYELYPNVNIAPYAGSGEIKYVFTSNSEEDLEETMSAFYSKFSEFIYGSLQDTLEGVVVDMLAQEKKTISTVESCTGGLLAGRITAVSGSSSVFSEGLITYSNEAKMKYLNIAEKTLKQHGAVSEECAHEMVANLQKSTGADICVSITGIAGPTGGSDEKPVGLVYFGISYLGNIKVYKQIFNGDREKVRDRSTVFALNLVRKELADAKNFY